MATAAAATALHHHNNNPVHPSSNVQPVMHGSPGVHTIGTHKTTHHKSSGRHRFFSGARASMDTMTKAAAALGSSAMRANATTTAATINKDANEYTADRALEGAKATADSRVKAVEKKGQSDQQIVQMENDQDLYKNSEMSFANAQRS